ncbi:hypothetical protein NDU88_004260 [Pleurodeles waltl]|uniref:Uncharacterized protein n=1 Tax=Pleurodeles waltl TaxID=8319 RepID=A0AAV7WTL4_PLEWA|nr:hypothetical protein NDU88_004260 [Pleurodeles waltl]
MPDIRAIAAHHQQPTGQGTHQERQTIGELPQRRKDQRVRPTGRGRLGDVEVSAWPRAKKHRERYSEPVDKFQKTTDRPEVEKTPPIDAECDVGMDKQQLSERKKTTKWPGHNWRKQ